MPGQPSPVFQIATRPVKVFEIPWWGWLLLLALPVAAAIYYWHQYQVRLQAIEAGRIAILEGK